MYESPLEVSSKSATIANTIGHSGGRPKGIPKRIAAVINLKSIDKATKHVNRKRITVEAVNGVQSTK
jgi:hypothetical protein